MKKVIKIEGMHCEHCKKRVENALSGIDGITVYVSLENACATVESANEIENKMLKDAVEDLGFDVADIKDQ